MGKEKKNIDFYINKLLLIFPVKEKQIIKNNNDTGVIIKNQLLNKTIYEGRMAGLPKINILCGKKLLSGY